jgi:hypothetical protein
MKSSLPNLDSILGGLRKTKKCCGQYLQFLHRNIPRNKESNLFKADVRLACIDRSHRTQIYRTIIAIRLWQGAHPCLIPKSYVITKPGGGLR